MEKPTMEKYGYHHQSGFDDQPSGWMFEGGEDAYYAALKKWETLIMKREYGIKYKIFKTKK